MPLRSLSTPIVAALLLCLLVPTVLWGQDDVLWVDQTASAGGDGSPQAPFQTLTQAVKQVKSGGTISIRAGVYRESIRLIQGGTDENPTTLQAAHGERVILSGFSDIAGWEKLKVLPHNLWMAGGEDRPTPRSPRPGRVPPGSSPERFGLKTRAPLGLAVG